MKYRTVFDIIGPVMIGPSSSHTAGAARIGRVARTLFGQKPDRADVYLYGSFAKTYRGHGTDVAIVGGLLDFDTFDSRIPDALTIAEQENIKIVFHEEEAIAGITSRIPCDEVIVAMYRIGQSMPEALRETAQGGLAATPTGRELEASIFGVSLDKK